MNFNPKDTKLLKKLKKFGLQVIRSSEGYGDLEISGRRYHCEIFEYGGSESLPFSHEGLVGEIFFDGEKDDGSTWYVYRKSSAAGEPYQIAFKKQ